MRNFKQSGGLKMKNQKLNFESTKDIILQQLQDIEKSISELKEDIFMSSDINNIHNVIKINDKYYNSKLTNIINCIKEYKED